MTVQRYLRALAVLCIVIPAAVFTGSIFERRSTILREAELRANGMVDIFQEHALKVLETQELMLDLVEDFVRETPEYELVTSATSYQLSQLARRLPQTVSIWITNATGSNIASSIPWSPDLNVTGFEFFEAQRHENQPRFISERYVGRTTGQPSFAMSRRRSNPDGSFAGTIHVAVNPSYFETYFQRVIGNGRGAASLLRADGSLLARYPRQTLPHRLSPESPVLRGIAAQPDGGLVEGVSSLDGTTRLYAYRRLGEFAAYVGFGVNMDVALAQWHRETAWRAGGLLAVIVTLCGIIWVVNRALTQRQEALTQLRIESALRHATQEKLHEARSLEALGRMARGVAHDFNNLLTVVIGNLEAAEQKSPDPSVQQALLSARRAAEAGGKLAASLLSYARTQVLKVEVLAVAPFLKNMAALLQDIATPSRKLIVDIPTDLANCLADRTHLQSTISNLVANARDATSPGGCITLTARVVELDSRL